MFEKIREFWGKIKSTRAEIDTIVTLAVALLIFAIIFPIVMGQIISANTSGWNPAVATVFSILVPVLGALVVVLLLVKKLTS